MAPIIDIYDISGHQEEGNSLWWYKRADSGGNEIKLGEVSCIKVINGGIGYTTTPQITFSGGGGNGAEAEAITYHGKIAEVRITNQGTGYTSLPEITIEGNGSGAELKVFISDGWHLGFARLKSDFEFGQDENPAFDEAKRQFSTKKDELKGTLKFTSLQDDVFTENFLSKEAHRYNWSIFQNAGLSRDNFNKYRYFSIVRIPRLYKSSAPGRVPDMKGILLINREEITVNTQDLPVAGLNGVYNIPAGDAYSVQEEINP